MKHVRTLQEHAIRAKGGSKHNPNPNPNPNPDLNPNPNPNPNPKPNPKPNTAGAAGNPCEGWVFNPTYELTYWKFGLARYSSFQIEIPLHDAVALYTFAPLEALARVCRMSRHLGVHSSYRVML
jgi:hypothetical protein